MKKFFVKHWPVILLFFFETILFLTNYSKGSFLIGWDNLFPELDFKLDFNRNIHAVWQEYRGLGLLDGMSHAANLVHDVERFIFSLFLPTSVIRWAYILSLHLVGGLGVYMLIRSLLKSSFFKNIGNKEQNSELVLKFSALLGALFYQYNLGTIQQFYLPFEAFVVHFAFLPWLIYWIIRFLRTGKKRDLMFFTFFSFFSIPQAHIPTLFIVYIFSLFLLFITHILIDKKTSIKRILILIFIIFGLNVYWGLPFAYSAFTNSSIISNSKNFQMSSNDIFFRNQKYGNITDVALIKGFFLDIVHYDFRTGLNEYMFLPWINHIKKPTFFIPAWIFFIIAVIGLVITLIKQEKRIIPFAILFLFSFCMMGIDIPIIRIISDLLRSNVPFFKTVFRFVFTKFSILYVFSYSILLASGTVFILKRVKKWVLKSFLSVSIVSLIIFYAWPSFQKNFFYKNLAVKIPDYYFETFDFFNSQNHNTRVAVLPIPWYWAWVQPKWGAINSGFIWYGIPQPIIDLAFTPWSEKNENFYWELEQAIYSENPELLSNVLRKYDINWVYFDTSILNDQAKRMTYDRYQTLLNKTFGIRFIKQIGSIYIYEFDLNDNFKSFISLKKNLKNIKPSYDYDNYDLAYLQYGDYFTDSNSNKDYEIYYPFRSLFSAKSPNDIEYLVEEDGEHIIFKVQFTETATGLLQIPELTNEEFSVFTKSDIYNLRSVTPRVYINDEFIPYKKEIISLVKNGILISYDIDDIFRIIFDKDEINRYESKTDPTFISQTNDACEKKLNGLATLDKLVSNGSYEFKFTSIGTNNCIKASLSNLSHQFGYLVKIKTTSDKKRGLFLNWYNETIGKSDLETYFENDGKYHNYFLIIPPRQQFGLGYTAYFSNVSEGTEQITNTLEDFAIYQIPYRFLKEIKIINQSANSNDTENKSNENYFLSKVQRSSINEYSIILDSTEEQSYITDNQILTLSQSFDSGWHAYQFKNQNSKIKNIINNAFPFLFGEEIKEHVLVNNWANGWLLNSLNHESIKAIKQTSDPSTASGQATIKIIYLPQYLEYLGFGFLILGFVFVIKYKSND